MEARRFYLDTSTRAFVSSPESNLPQVGNVFFNEDVEQVELYFLRQSGGARPEYIDYSGNTVKLAIGLTSPAALVTSFSAISATIAITSSVTITGGSGTNEVQRIQIAPRPELGSFALQLPARNIAVSSITSSFFIAPFHGLLNGQSVTLTGFTISSGFTNGQQVFIRDRTRDNFRVASAAGGAPLTVSATSGGTAQLDAITTGVLPANATPQQVQSAIISAGVAVNGQPQVVVTGEPNDYVLTYAGALAGVAVPTAQIVGSTLAGAPGLGAILSLNTNEIAALVAAGQGGGVTMEVEVFDPATTARQTYQQGASLADDIITSTSPIPASVGPTISTLNFDDGYGGTWTVTVDPNGVLTATKQ
jgi:hypothetical protein